MKTIKYISIIFSMLFALVGCSDDLTETRFDHNNAKSGELLPIQSKYVLLLDNAEQEAEIFKWGKMDFGYPASIEYTLEIDLKGHDFENAQAVTAVNSLSASVSVSELNKAMLELQKVYKFVQETPQDVEFRIKGSVSEAAKPVYTNSIASNITPYFEYNKVWLIGAYCDWKHLGNENIQYLYEYDDTKSNIFEAWVDFGTKASEGFKLTGAANWDKGNWGTASGATIESEASSIKLIDDGGSGNISAYSNRFYKFSYNTNTLVLTKLSSMNSLGITGSAVQGGADVKMEFEAANQVFVTKVTLGDGAIKFRADGDNAIVYGKASADGKLMEQGADIDVKAGTYTIRVNLNNSLDLNYSIEGAQPLDPNNLIAPKLEANGDIGLATTASYKFSWSELNFNGQDKVAVTYSLEMDLEGASFANAKVLGTTKDLSMEVSGADLAKLIKELKPNTEVNKADNIELRIVANVLGLSNPIVSEVDKATLSILEFSATLFMIGEDFGNWNWKSEDIVEMTPVHSVQGAFWTIKYLEADKQFKWSPVADWNGDFSGLDNSIGFEQADGNALVKESGLYMIYVDMNTKTIKIESPEVYGMGDAFGGWDTRKYKFTVEDNKLTYSPTLESKELRMYAVSSISSVSEGDWWKMEFILRDGKIEYRGAGDDQNPRVSIEVNKKIILDFTANTGLVE